MNKTSAKNRGVNSKVALVGTYAGQNTQWQAEIARTEGVIDNKSRMSYLVAEVNDPYLLESSASITDAPLRFGSYVNAQIMGNKLTEATLIPRYLVVNGKVAILNNESKLHYVAIDIVRQQGSNVVVSNGLVDGDQLIVSALDYPVDGMRLALISDDINETKQELKPTEDSTSETQVANNDNKSSGE